MVNSVHRLMKQIRTALVYKSLFLICQGASLVGKYLTQYIMYILHLTTNLGAQHGAVSHAFNINTRIESQNE